MADTELKWATCALEVGYRFVDVHGLEEEDTSIKAKPHPALSAEAVFGYKLSVAVEGVRAQLTVGFGGLACPRLQCLGSSHGQLCLHSNSKVTPPPPRPLLHPCNCSHAHTRRPTKTVQRRSGGRYVEILGSFFPRRKLEVG